MLHAGCEITSVDEAATTVTLGDGTTVKADVILGADGVHSRTRKVVFGESYQEQPSALSCFRFLIRTQNLLDDPETRIFVEKPGSMMDLVGPDRRIILYPCSQGEYLNVLPIVPRRLAEGVYYRLPLSSDDLEGYSCEGQSSRVEEGESAVCLFRFCIPGPADVGEG